MIYVVVQIVFLLVPPRPEQLMDAVRQLDAELARDRDVAERRLLLWGRFHESVDFHRIMRWGERYNRSPEVRYRCAQVMRALDRRWQTHGHPIFSTRHKEVLTAKPRPK